MGRSTKNNYQRRVEIAQEKRKESKQRKQQTKEKRAIKSMAQELFNMLDRNMDGIRRRSSSFSIGISSNGNITTVVDKQDHPKHWEIHLWTDTLPSNSPPFLDLVDADLVGPEGGKSNKGKKTSRRARSGSGSLSQQQQEEGIGGGGAKNSKKNKKMHPRSKKAADADDDSDKAQFAPLLCRSHFFSGKCADPQRGGKKGGCRCVHYNNKQFKTISAILSDKQQQQQQQQKQALEKSEEACAVNPGEDVMKGAPGSMEMVYYLTIPIPSNIGESRTTPDDSEEERGQTQTPGSISDLITDKLNQSSCSATNIVYMVLSSPSRDVLLYDRNQEGLIISDFSAQVLGANNTAANAPLHAQQLPVSILEHILTFLEAPAVASASQVCTAWHREIGQASPNLWKHFLRQRSWPLPYDDDDDDTTSGDQDTGTSTKTNLQEYRRAQSLSKLLRNEFIKHYSILRDMRAVQLALTGLLTKKSCEEKEMTFQAFSARRGAPQSPNNCLAVEVWSPNHVLAAYSNDCTLRLFQAVPRGGANHMAAAGENSNSRLSEKSCRELLCQCIDPYKNTKKKVCYMEAIGLDENVIGCICSVSDETLNFRSPHILVVLSRDDLLVVDSSADAAGRISQPEEGALQVIDVEEAVLNYILSLDHVDNRLLRLNDFLALGGDSEEIEFIVSQSMVACGYGRFMVEVAISIPLPDDEDEDDDDDDAGDDMLLLDRKLFLFSSSLGSIVWMGHSNPPSAALRPRLEDMTLACLREALPGSATRSSCTVASVSHAVAPLLPVCEIGHSGHIERNFLLGSSEWTENQMLQQEGWRSRLDGRRPIVVTKTDIVVGDTLTRQPDGANAEREYKSTVAFYSRVPATDNQGESIHTISVGENCLIDSMVGIRDDYVILICRFLAETGFAAVDGGGGHWGAEMPAKVYALTIHVPTRSEIERLCLYEDFGANKLTLALSSDTVACGVWLKGLIMTGSDVRSVGMPTLRSTESVVAVDHSKNYGHNHNVVTPYNPQKEKLPPLDPLITLQVPMDQHTKSETPLGSASSRSSIASICFLPHRQSSSSAGNQCAEEEGDDDSSDSDEELNFQCRTLLQSESRAANDPTRAVRQAAATTSLLHSGGNQFLASCHANGELLLWDLGQHKVLNEVCLAKNRGPGWQVRRIEDTDQFLYQTRDPQGIISIHAWDHPPGSSATTAGTSCATILSFPTYSQTFCSAAPCASNPNLLALPSAQDSHVTIRDLRMDPVSSQPVAVFPGSYGAMESNANDDAFHSNGSSNRKHGMLTSLAFSESLPSDSSRPIVACGMESGTVFFHDLRMLVGKNPNLQPRAGTSSSYYKVSSDPVLALDLAPSHGNNKIAFEANTTGTSSGVVAIAGMAGENVTQQELSQGDQGTVAILKATILEPSSSSGDSNNDALKVRLRSRLATCRPSGDGKPGVNLCRFQPGEGRLFAVAGWDHRVRIFDRTAQANNNKASKSLLAVLRGHATSVSAMDWAPDSMESGICATGASDGKIHVWRCFSKN